MHELSLATSLVEQVLDISRKENVQLVKEITITIGELSGVNTKAFEFCFPEVIKGTLLDECKLIIKEVETIIQCNSCQSKKSTDPNFLICKNCSSLDVKIIQGAEFQLTSMEVL